MCVQYLKIKQCYLLFVITIATKCIEPMISSDSIGKKKCNEFLMTMVRRNRLNISILKFNLYFANMYCHKGLVRRS